MDSDARERLRFFRHRSTNDQRTHRADIEDAFQRYIVTDPGPDEFADTMEGIILTSRMLYFAIYGRRSLGEANPTIADDGLSVRLG